MSNNNNEVPDESMASHNGLLADERPLAEWFHHFTTNSTILDSGARSSSNTRTPGHYTEAEALEAFRTMGLSATNLDSDNPQHTEQMPQLSQHRPSYAQLNV